MLDIVRRIGRLHRGSPTRRRATAVRWFVERLEGRELLASLPPTGLVATGASASSIALTWNAVNDPNLTGYNVIEKVWVSGGGGGKGSHGGGHYVYNTITTGVTTTSYTVGGLGTGTGHTYIVTATDPSGTSAYSVPAAGETWAPPSLPSGEFLLSSGALWSGPVPATNGMSVQIVLLGGGNPLNYSVASGPKTVSITAHTGVVTYTPGPTESGTVNVTFQASNALGSATQTVQFNVTAPNPSLATPKVTITGTKAVFNGSAQSVSVSAVGTDGVTPVSGSFALAYDGGLGGGVDAGTYSVLATFTSNDPNYNNATALGTLTIAKGQAKFAYLTKQTIAFGTPTTTFTGYFSDGTYVLTGEWVAVTLNGVPVAATVSQNSTFAATLDTSSLPVGTYTVGYYFPGDANLKTAKATSTLKVIPDAPPKVTLNPVSQTVTDGDGVTFTAAATGSPVPSVQWQVSTDGGQTWSNFYDPYGTTLSFIVSLGDNGNEYRAVFTNTGVTATTTAAVLTVESDTGGGGGNANRILIGPGTGVVALIATDLDPVSKHHRGGALA
jgi:hypothetical protein